MTTITKAGIEQAGLAWLPGAGWRIAHGPDIAPGTSGWVATGPAGHPEIPARRGRLMHKYEVIIYWSNEDGVYVAEAPELPGCAAHGDTQEAALENIGQAVDLWLETAREFGDPIPEPKGERLMLT